MCCCAVKSSRDVCVLSAPHKRYVHTPQWALSYSIYVLLCVILLSRDVCVCVCVLFTVGSAAIAHANGAKTRFQPDLHEFSLKASDVCSLSLFCGKVYVLRRGWDIIISSSHVSLDINAQILFDKSREFIYNIV